MNVAEKVLSLSFPELSFSSNSVLPAMDMPELCAKGGNIGLCDGVNRVRSGVLSVSAQMACWLKWKCGVMNKGRNAYRTVNSRLPPLCKVSIFCVKMENFNNEMLAFKDDALDLGHAALQFLVVFKLVLHQTAGMQNGGVVFLANVFANA